MTPIRLSEIERLAREATPGPWYWRQSNMGRIELAAPHGGGTVVMDFARYGMHGAVPRFAVCDDDKPRGKRGGVLEPADKLIRANPDGMLTHPDAEWIASCNPQTVLKLIEVARAANAVAKSNGFDAALPDKQAALRAACEGVFN